MIAVNKRTKKRYVVLGIEKPLPIVGGGRKTDNQRQKETISQKCEKL